VEQALRQLQREFPRINAGLSAPRDAMDELVVGNMLAGYAYVDGLVARGVDVFAMGSHRHLLELNTLVLCGTDEASRRAYEAAASRAEERFYDLPGGGIRDAVEWYARHSDRSPWRRAAGVYIRIVSQPQLFVEGNHRTGGLVMSYLLLREGLPPFVLSPRSAMSYFEPSSRIRNTGKEQAMSLLRFPRFERHLASLLQAHADPALLSSSVTPGRC
jgi:hypothetical protein